MNLESGNLGFISIHRTLQDKSWYSDPEYLSLWVHLLLSANHRDKFVDGIEVKRGQFKTGRNQLSEKTGINASKIERILTYFEKSEQQIEQLKNNRYRIITIKNYDAFQNVNSKVNIHEQPANSKRTAKNTNNNTNNGNSSNNKKTVYSDDFNNVWLLYPISGRKEKKKCYGFYIQTVKTDQEKEKIKKALKNYSESRNVKDGYIQGASRWFKHWEDWIEHQEELPAQKQLSFNEYCDKCRASKGILTIISQGKIKKVKCEHK